MPIPPEQLATLIDRHWVPLVAWVGRRSGNAEDIVQQAFLQLATVKVSPDSPAAWLYSVARNRAINEGRSQQRRNHRQQSVARSENFHDNVARSAEAAELIEKLNQLPDQQREIVVAKTWGGFNFQEIAELVGSSKATVWRQYESAISTLRLAYGVKCETKK